MTSIYEIEGEGGRINEVEGDRPPTKEEAQKAFGLADAEEGRAKKEADRAPLLDKISEAVSSALLTRKGVVKAILSGGGKVGDVAADVVPAIGGSIAGAVAGPGGAAAGGAAGSTAGNLLRQTREYFRGERDDFSKGQAVAAAAMGAIPAGSAAKTVAGTVAMRGAQGAGLGVGAKAVETLIDRKELPSWGEVGFAAGGGLIFGGALGGLEKGVPAIVSKFRSQLEGKSPAEASAVLTKAIETADPADQPPLLALRDFVGEKMGIVSAKPTAAESAARKADVTAAIVADETPAAIDAQIGIKQASPELGALNAKLAGQEAEGNAVASATALERAAESRISPDDTLMLGGNPAKEQVTNLDVRLGADTGAAAERARLGAEIDASTPKVEGGDIPAGVKLSPQAQRIADEYGFVAPKLAAALAGGTSGFVYGASTGEDPLDRLKRGAMFGVAGVGGGYMLGKRFLTSNGATPLRAGMDVLADVDKVLTKPAAPSLAGKAAGAPEAMRTAFITRFAPLDTLEANVMKAAGRAVPEVPLSRKFEQVAGATGKALIDVQDFETAVLPHVAGNERDFDRLLFLKRTGQRLQADVSLSVEKARISAIPAAARSPDEVATMALPDNRRRVADWTIDKVDRGLAQLEQAIGPKRFAELDQTAAGGFQQELDRGLQLQVTAGRISSEAYAAIKASNDFYAPFRVLRTLEDIDAGRVAPGVDTKQQIVNAITGIDDAAFRLDSPTKAAAENIFNGRVLAEKNLKMLELAKLTAFDTNGIFVRKLKSWETPRKDFELVNFFEGGTAMRLEVNPKVAEAIKGMNPIQTGIVGDLARRMGSAFRFGATSANLAFQARNIAFADQPRLMLMSKYGANVGDAINPLRIPIDFTHALMASIKSNVFGDRKDGLARAFYESGAAGSTLQDAIGKLGGRFDPGSIGDKTAGAGRDVLDKFGDVARVLEETTKMMGFKRALRIEGIDKLPPAKAAAKMDAIVAEIRNFAGSPDFARGGNVAKDLSMLTLFFNARVQGGASDLGRLAGGDGMRAAAVAWTRLGAAAGIPAAYFWLRNQEPENKADFEKVPSWEKENYVMIPRTNDKGAPLYFTNAQGEQVREYWRVPKRESTATIANLTTAALEFANSKDPAAVAQFAVNFIEQTSPLNITGNNGSERIESVKASLNPLLKVPLEVTANRDFFRHRDVVPQSRQGGSPENQFFAGSTPQGYVDAAKAMPQFLWDPLRSPLMLQHIVGSTTGGFINQFMPDRQRKGTRDADTAALASNPVGRVFVRSQQNDNAAAEKDVADAKQSVRDRQIGLSNTAAEQLDLLASMPEADRGAHLTDIAQKRPEVIEAIAGEMERRAKGFNSVDRVAITLPVESGERTAFIFKQLMKKPEAERGAYLEDQVKKEIVTMAVLEQLAERIAAGKN